MFEREQQDEGDRATVQFDFVEESPRVRNFPLELVPSGLQTSVSS